MFSESEELAKVKIETSIIPWDDQETKVLTALAGGMVIDIIFTFAMVRGTFAKKGVTMNLDPLIKAEGYDLSKYFPGSIDVFRYRGEPHGLPIDYQANLYYYNRAMFQEAGLTEPYDLWKEGKWTFETFVDYATKLSKGEGDKRQFGAGEFPKTLRIQNPAIKGFGGRIWNEDFTKTELNSPKALEAWDFLADHVRKGWSPTTAGRDSDYQQVMMGLFNSGKLAMFQNHRTFLGSVDKDLDLGMTEIPIWPATGKAGGRSTSNGFAIGKATAYPAQSWIVLKHIAERGGELLAYNEAGGPNTYAVFNSPEWRKLLRPSERTDVYVASLTNGVPDDLPPGFNEMDKIAQAAYDEIALGLKSAKEAMDAAAADIQRVVDEQQ